ncbi:enediyne antibiotic chromoprotein [Phytohabitans houttuyneae]|uniref:Neocarzinostatin n=1 Tax=Phytohabitans houttuyneae TaxID=1076126 RepID=A0A6V8K3G3_9ACTN|nr:enediyne antibiotic chromoprotein [Phytohabitans houttuyneae]GFJ76828.1 hypothetical protein Phou_010080 [Phytohabitans houttuyneae]
MRSNSRIRRAVRLALVPVAVLAMALAGQSAAQAAEPEAAAASISVSPSTGLTDGQSVTASVTGLSPEAAVGQCTFVSNDVVCDPGSWVQFPTSGGNGSSALTVHQSFEGFTVAEDGTFAYWGTVDCTVLPCVVGGTDGLVVVTAAISF